MSVSFDSSGTTVVIIIVDHDDVVVDQTVPFLPRRSCSTPL